MNCTKNGAWFLQGCRSSWCRACFPRFRPSHPACAPRREHCPQGPHGHGAECISQSSWHCCGKGKYPKPVGYLFCSGQFAKLFADMPHLIFPLAPLHINRNSYSSFAEEEKCISGTLSNLSRVTAASKPSPGSHSPSPPLNPG